VADQRDIATFKFEKTRARRRAPARASEWKKQAALLEALFTLARGFVCRTR